MPWRPHRAHTSSSTDSRTKPSGSSCWAEVVLPEPATPHSSTTRGRPRTCSPTGTTHLDRGLVAEGCSVARGGPSRSSFDGPSRRGGPPESGSPRTRSWRGSARGSRTPVTASGGAHDHPPAVVRRGHLPESADDRGSPWVTARGLPARPTAPASTRRSGSRCRPTVRSRACKSPRLVVLRRG